MRRVTAALLIVATGLFACGTDRRTPVSSRPKIDQLSMELPPELVGLKVQREEIKGVLQKVRPSYVREAALYSLRTPDDLVQATLQVSRFKDEARYQTNQFRRTIINQLGATPPRATRMDEKTVWRTSGSKLALAVWFDGRFMYLLSIRDDFDKPRMLIRTLLSQSAQA